jgi:iron complex outermembrane receptor protein
MNAESAGGYTTLAFNAGWRLPDLVPGLSKMEVKVNIFNLTDKRALTFDRVTTLLAQRGALDPHTGAALYAAGAYYNLLEPRSYMLTLSASLF